MTIPEQASGVAKSAIEGLKTSPSCLAAILLAALFAILVYISAQREAERAQARLEVFTRLLDQCMEARDLGK